MIKRISKVCPYCGNSFFTMTDAQKFCSKKHVEEFHTADVYLSMKICARDGCGVSFNPIRKWQKYCSTPCQLTDYNKKHDISGRLREQRTRTKAEVAARIAKMHDKDI